MRWRFTTKSDPLSWILTGEGENWLWIVIWSPLIHCRANMHTHTQTCTHAHKREGGVGREEERETYRNKQNVFF